METPGQILLAALIGLVAGVIGGLAGIGGSMIMLPGLALLLGFDDEAHTRHHVFMAAAMTVNIMVALPAARRHYQAGAVRVGVVRALLPAMAAMIIVGVLVSNLIRGDWLKQALAVFIAGYALLNLYRLVRQRRESEGLPERTGVALLAAIGGGAGFIGGLLGLGGGVVTVPLLQVLARIRLRQAIATSSAVMPLTALIGAGLKLGTLPGHGRSVWEALLIAVAMGPGAIVGAMVGATLTHALPLAVVRGVISVLLLAAAAKLAGLF